MINNNIKCFINYSLIQCQTRGRECGRGRKERLVVCRDSTGRELNQKHCIASEMPKGTASCKVHCVGKKNPRHRYKWRKGHWKPVKYPKSPNHDNNPTNYPSSGNDIKPPFKNITNDKDISKNSNSKVQLPNNNKISEKSNITMGNSLEYDYNKDELSHSKENKDVNYDDSSIEIVVVYNVSRPIHKTLHNPKKLNIPHNNNTKDESFDKNNQNKNDVEPKLIKNINRKASKNKINNKNSNNIFKKRRPIKRRKSIYKKY